MVLVSIIEEVFVVKLIWNGLFIEMVHKLSFFLKVESRMRLAALILNTLLFRLDDLIAETFETHRRIKWKCRIDAFLTFTLDQTFGQGWDFASTYQSSIWTRKLLCTHPQKRFHFIFLFAESAWAHTLQRRFSLASRGSKTSSNCNRQSSMVRILHRFTQYNLAPTQMENFSR